jgi:hypothetical protein
MWTVGELSHMVTIQPIGRLDFTLGVGSAPIAGCEFT